MSLLQSPPSIRIIIQRTGIDNMGYLLDIVGSFIIAGMVIMILLAVNINYSASSSAILFTTIEQRKVTDVSELIEYDFYKLGYRIADEKIAIADSNEIKFYTDIDNNEFADSIHYYLGETTDLSYTTNPKDKPLYRKRNDQDSLSNEMPVVDFYLSYFDSIGNTLDYASLTSSAGRKLIKSIKIKITVESDEMYDDHYRASEWKKKISPKNLR
jgi:lipopolysaccharide export LptBFGC system permease protein LptF